APSESVPYYLYCLRLRRLVLIFVNPLYRHSRKNKKIKNTKLKYRHSRAGGNLGLSVRKLIGKNGFSNPETPDSCFRRNPVF
ncbi:hypothetical protein, partial [Neisseria meningitidis]|uniref:hypothetical protein n=4 Tax=Neisseria meningitidis TaxID=487 RepID=UPI0021A2CAEA